ncbi:hypothetical protein E1B28_000132 [Marasmius oreades]|uniref:Uncharacterized protein n=1 Tax=Marasmius oreades TaxID=181124 RepID=A0A9P7V0S2_9AGAR|nr:uncharacterized protein E1B28_000132 [Marasmius oreades]KAG7098163.1 hypothetical protein E1B28_000132 [Marasmius oreades]
MVGIIRHLSRHRGTIYTNSFDLHGHDLSEDEGVLQHMVSSCPLFPNGLYTPPPEVFMMSAILERPEGYLSQPNAANESDEDMGSGLFDDESMDTLLRIQAPKGSLSNHLQGSPGHPLRNAERTPITIVELQLHVTWYSIVKADRRVQLIMKADVHNSSMYTLLPGNANIYVDGSFISKSRIPSVSPWEHFGCALGIGPSVRIT